MTAAVDEYDRIIALVRAQADEPRPGQRVCHLELMAAAQLLTEAARKEHNAGNAARASEINQLVLSVFGTALRVEDLEPCAPPPSPSPGLPDHVAAKVREGHTFQVDDPHPLSRARRWTCTVCTDPVLTLDTAVYGGATERSCPESQTFWAARRGPGRGAVGEPGIRQQGPRLDSAPS